MARYIDTVHFVISNAYRLHSFVQVRLNTVVVLIKVDFYIGLDPAVIYLIRVDGRVCNW